MSIGKHRQPWRFFSFRAPFFKVLGFIKIKPRQIDFTVNQKQLSIIIVRAVQIKFWEQMTLCTEGTLRYCSYIKENVFI